MLYGCATWIIHTQNFDSRRTTHHKPRLRVIGCRRKDRTGCKPLSYGETLERTGFERIETTIRKRQVGFAGALLRQGKSRLSKQIMFGRLAVQKPPTRKSTNDVMGTASRKTSTTSERFRAKAKNGNGSHSELFSTTDGIGWCCEDRGYVCSTGGSRREWKPLITPGDTRTPANPTCGADARLVDLYSGYVYSFWFFILFIFVLFL